MKKDKIKHVVFGLIIFALGWYIWNSDIGLILVGFAAVGKEFNDATGIIKPLLSKGKKTGFNFLDIVYTVVIPLIIQIYLNNFIN